MKSCARPDRVQNFNLLDAGRQPFEPSVPDLRCVTLGAKSVDSGRLFGHSAAEKRSCALTKERPREFWAIFPTRYRSFDGARFCPETRDIFREKSLVARGTRWGGGSKATTTSNNKQTQSKGQAHFRSLLLLSLVVCLLLLASGLYRLAATLRKKTTYLT